MKSLLKYSLIPFIIFASLYDALSSSSIDLPANSTGNIYIRIYNNDSGEFVTGGETVAGEGDNWLQAMEISGGYFRKIDENGLLTGGLEQYNTSILIEQNSPSMALLTQALVNNMSLEVEVIFMTTDDTGMLQVGYTYVLELAELRSIQHINSKDFEVKTIRLDVVSQEVGHSDDITSTISVLSF